MYTTKNNLITLFSKYQIREYGLVINSVTKKHQKSATDMSSQQLVLSKHICVLFENMEETMGFEMFPIQLSDFQNSKPMYNVLLITGAAIWTPSQFWLHFPPLLMHISIVVDNNSTTLQLATSNAREHFLYDPSDTEICFSNEVAHIVFDANDDLKQSSQKVCTINPEA